jgi:hypothetical protein
MRTYPKMDGRERMLAAEAATHGSSTQVAGTMPSQ